MHTGENSSVGDCECVRVHVCVSECVRIIPYAYPLYGYSRIARRNFVSRNGLVIGLSHRPHPSTPWLT